MINSLKKSTIIILVLIIITVVISYIVISVKNTKLLWEPIGEERGLYIQENESVFIDEMSELFFDTRTKDDTRILIVSLCSQMKSQRSLSLIVIGMYDANTRIQIESRTALDWRANQMGDKVAQKILKDISPK
jgi:hypothetical protein